MALLQSICFFIDPMRWKILITLGFVLIFFYGSMVSGKFKPLIYSQKLSSHIHLIRRDLFLFNKTYIMQQSQNHVSRIYEEQLQHHRIAPFIPTYENRRLMLKFNLTSLAIFLHPETNHSQGSSRYLRIQCLTKHYNSTNVHLDFHFLLHFHIEMLNKTAIHFYLDPQTKLNPPLFLLTTPTTVRFDLVVGLTIQVQKIFPIDTLFRFTYQWLDQNITNDLYWPQWPITKSCANTILKSFNEDLTSCSLVNTLKHQKPQDLFKNERSAIIDWLDFQYLRTPCHISSKRRPVPFEITSNLSVCTSEFHEWISEYQDWHANTSARISDPLLTFEQQQQLIVQENVRFMLYESSDSGVADRLGHLMTTYMIAILTKRLFIFDPTWPELSEIMQVSLNYDRNITMPWFNQHKFTMRRHKFSFDRLQRDYDYDREFTERILMFWGHTGGIVHMMVSKTSVYRKFLTEKLRMSAEAMFGCLHHTLFLFRLSSFVDSLSQSMASESLGHSPSQLLQILLSPSIYPIGVQVRTGDAMLREDQGSSKIPPLKSFHYFLTCVHDFVQQNRTFSNDPKQVPVIFLLADDPRVRRLALEDSKLLNQCLPTNNLPVIASSDSIHHIGFASQRSLALRLALFDILLFGLCEQHVITAESGFGNMGAYAALKRRKLYSLSIAKNETCQGLNRDIPLVESSYRWSGI